MDRRAWGAMVYRVTKSQIQLKQLSTQTVACQAPLSMGFPRQEYWSGLPFPSLGGSSQFRDETQVAYLAGKFSITEPHGESICILLSPLFVFPSHLGPHRALSRVPYAIE